MDGLLVAASVLVWVALLYLAWRGPGPAWRRTLRLAFTVALLLWISATYGGTTEPAPIFDLMLLVWMGSGIALLWVRYRERRSQRRVARPID